MLELLAMGHDHRITIHSLFRGVRGATKTPIERTIVGHCLVNNGIILWAGGGGFLPLTVEGTPRKVKVFQRPVLLFRYSFTMALHVVVCGFCDV